MSRALDLLLIALVACAGWWLLRERPSVEAASSSAEPAAAAGAVLRSEAPSDPAGSEPDPPSADSATPPTVGSLVVGSPDAALLHSALFDFVLEGPLGDDGASALQRTTSGGSGGRLRFDDLEPGEYRFRARFASELVVHESGGLEVVAGEELAPPELQALQLAAAVRTVTVTVTDASGRPIEGARVALHLDPTIASMPARVGPATSNAGELAVPIPIEGESQLTIRARGFLPLRIPAPVEDAGVRLEPAPRVRILVEGDVSLYGLGLFVWAEGGAQPAFGGDLPLPHQVGAFDQARGAELALPGPGRYFVRWTAAEPDQYGLVLDADLPTRVRERIRVADQLLEIDELPADGPYWISLSAELAEAIRAERTAR